MKIPDVVVVGEENGEGMIIRFQTGKGTEIYGLGIPNVYTDSDWSLGPTWCFLITGKKKTLIDTGRFGNHEMFKSLHRLAGFSSKPFPITLPAHRLYFNGQFNLIHDASDRAREIIFFLLKFLFGHIYGRMERSVIRK